MVVYFSFILFILVVGGLAHYNNSRMKVITNSTNEQAVILNKNSISKNANHYGIWWLILFAGIFFIQAFRFYVGADYGYYFNVDVDWQFVVDKFKNFDEPLLYLVSFIARGIWDHPLANIIAFSFFITLFLFYGISNYDDNDITISLLLYTLVGGLLFAFNGVQQALALTFIFACSKRSEKHWVLKYVIVILIASMIHKSALMFLPFLILSQFKINKYQQVLLVGSAFAVPLFFNFGYQIMEVANRESEYILESINPIRVLVAFAPLVLLYFVDRKTFFGKNYFVTNMTILNAMLTLTTMNSAYLNRFTKYLSIYLIIFVPKCLKDMPKKSRLISSIVIVLLYFMYFTYEVSISSSLSDFRWIFPYMHLYE